MFKKWAFFLSAIFLAHCQTSLDKYDPDAQPDGEEPQEDAADGADAGDTAHDPIPGDTTPDLPMDQPADEAAPDPCDAPPDRPADIVRDEAVVDIPVDEAPVDAPPDDLHGDDPSRDEVVHDITLDDAHPDDTPTETTERCDNGRDDDGDGRVDCMDSDCLPAGSCTGTCYPLSEIACGGSVIGTTLDPFATDRIVQPSCVTYDSWTGPETAYTFTLAERRQVTLDLGGLTADLDLFLLGDSGGRCDGADCIDRSIVPNADPEHLVATLDPGTYHILVDGYTDYSSAFSLSLACHPPEICDNLSDDDGDGLADCDDPDCAPFPACVRTCTPAGPVSCAAVLSGSTTGLGSTNVILTYSCSTYEENGPEIAYTFMSPAGGSVTFTIDALASSNLDLFILENDGGRCNPYRCLDHSASDDPSDTVTITAAPGTTYYVVIDGYASSSGAFRLSVTCP